MSDRIIVLEAEDLVLYRDGESGTSRPFVNDDENVDLSLAQLRTLHDALGPILSDIEREPCSFNAEVRRAEQTQIERCAATPGHPDVRCQLAAGHSGMHVCGDIRTGGYMWPVVALTGAQA